MCEGFVLKIKYLILATISGAIISLDQLIKIYIHTHYHLGEVHQVIAGIFDITYIRNYGAAFGILSSAAEHIRGPFFALVPFIAMIAIIMILRTTHDSQRLQVCALSLIFGGAIGNYIDRIRFSYVIDFLDFHYKDIYHWPAFNIADSAIVCGVTILFIQMIFAKSSKTISSQKA
jgi:signal peptidase II